MSTEQTFERSLAELESIVEKLEVGELQLEESLELFERGVTLIRDCRGRLTGAERRIEELTSDLSTEPILDDGK